MRRPHFLSIATTVITGSFGADLQGSYVMVPFDVPAGTTQVTVRYGFESGHTLDLGVWDPAGLRGWGGSSHPEVQLTAQGPSSEEEYRRAPKANVPGRTTRGFRPGPVRPGRWEAELGVAAVDRDEDGRVDWRVEVETRDDPAFARDPWRPPAYDGRPVRGAGWYVGDLHVHGEHSALGDAPTAEVAEYGFGPAGLDFLTLSDYVTDTGWADVARVARRHPDRLIARSSEVITYRGHFNNHVSGRYVDHRTGPVLEWRDGRVVPRRGATPVADRLRKVREAGGVTQINHPTIFPSSVPGFAAFCRGCPWDHVADLRLVDAIEVATGPAGTPGLGNNPFTTTAIDFYERALATGAKIAAVGVSDSHDAGRPGGPTESPIGTGATAVYADELSEAGFARAVRARHTYAKVFGARGPDVRLEATVPGSTEPPAIMGDVVRAARATLTARVLRGAGQRLEWWRDGRPVGAAIVPSADAVLRLEADRPGRYRLQLSDGGALTTVTSPVWLDPAARPPAGTGDARLPARVRARTGRFVRVPRTIRCSAEGLALQRCTIRLRAGGRTVARGSAPLRGGEARVRVRLTRAGRAVARHRPRVRATLEARATGPRGAVGPARRRVVVVARGTSRRP